MTYGDDDDRVTRYLKYQALVEEADKMSPRDRRWDNAITALKAAGHDVVAAWLQANVFSMRHNYKIKTGNPNFGKVQYPRKADAESRLIWKAVYHVHEGDVLYIKHHRNEKVPDAYRTVLIDEAIETVFTKAGLPVPAKCEDRIRRRLKYGRPAIQARIDAEKKPVKIQAITESELLD